MNQDLHPFKWLSMMGAFAGVIVLIEALCLEIPMIQEISSIAQSKDYSVCCLMGFAVCLFGLYSIAPYYLKAYGATVYNLSLLTTSLYGLVFEVLFLHQTTFDWLYLVGFCFVLVGIVLYNISSTQQSSNS